MSLFIKKLSVRLAAILIAAILTVSAIRSSPKPGDKGSNSTSNSIDNNQQSQDIDSIQEDTTSASLSKINPMPNLVSSSDSSIIKGSVLLLKNIMSTDFAEVPCLQSPALQYEEQVISCLDQESTNLSYLIDDNIQNLISLHNKAINDCNVDNEFLGEYEIINNQFFNSGYQVTSPISVNTSNICLSEAESLDQDCSESELLVPDWSEIKRINLQNNINNKIQTNNSPFRQIQVELNDSDSSVLPVNTTILDCLCVPPDQVSTNPSDSDKQQM